MLHISYIGTVFHQYEFAYVQENGVCDMLHTGTLCKTNFSYFREPTLCEFSNLNLFLGSHISHTYKVNTLHHCVPDLYVALNPN